MSVIDALSVFAGGVSKGYRQKQQINRQLVEERRKALLDEREMRLHEQSAMLDEKLKQGQIEAGALDLVTKRYNLDQLKNLDQLSITPNNQPFELNTEDLAGNKQKVKLPGDLRILTHPQIRQFISDQLKGATSERVAGLGASSRETVADINARAKRASDEARINFKIQYGINAGDSPIKRYGKYMSDILNGAKLDQLGLVTPEERRAYQQSQIELMKEHDIEAYNSGHPKAAAVSDTTKTKIKDSLGIR